MILILKMLVLLIIVSCTTNYHFEGPTKAIITPNTRVDIQSAPTTTESSSSNSNVASTMEKIMQEDFKFLEEETEITEDTKIVNGTDNSKEVGGNDKSRVKKNDSKHETEVNTDVEVHR